MNIYNMNKKIPNPKKKHTPKYPPTNDDYATFKQAIRVKISSLKDIVKRTILSAQKYKLYDIYGANELNICISSLENIFSQLHNIQSNLKVSNSNDENFYINKLQDITAELSSLFRTFGTERIHDLLSVCYGKDFIKTYLNSPDMTERFKVMNEHIHPIGYKIMSWKADTQKPDNKKSLKKNRIVEDFMIVESADNLDCYDLARTSKAFLTKVYGIKFCVHNPEQRNTLIVCALVDDIMNQCIDHPITTLKIARLHKSMPNEPVFEATSFNRFIQCLTLKELLVYDNAELHNRYIGYMNQIHLMKQKTISQITKDFIGSELYLQRTTLIQLLLKSDEHEYQYLAYLLYDLLSNDVNGHIDTNEQTLLFDSLPWDVKRYFRDAMRQTITYTNNLSNFDNNKIPLEQQICLMKADDTIKEKAMQKLKEVKAKTEDSGIKARQYLEGLLRIPFGIYKEEPILHVMSLSNKLFCELVKNIQDSDYPITSFTIKEHYTSMEVRKFTQLIKTQHQPIIKENFKANIILQLINVKRTQLIANICNINILIRKHSLSYPRICHSAKKISIMKDKITDFINHFQEHYSLLLETSSLCSIHKENNDIITQLSTTIPDIENKNKYINSYMKDVKHTLDDAVHGHDDAKRQVERIIGQWINGDKSGYCFGFEGPPGVGKTSLAKKGIANCLKDDNGVSRPFAFIAIGGSSNGSTLDGHNYTYVGSTWGRIADILMENKCMNPIIFIDELDKVSKTEHGKELIGILTHLIDPTQNDIFEDKYFSGINLDLSKALFIFSYNDASAIDRILLDRIHRIKFKHLTLLDKITVTKTFIFPEIYKKMGLEGMIHLSDDIIELIIEEYTCEPGVRKLKEILFEIIGEINLEILQSEENLEIPIIINKHDIKNKYLKKRHEMKPKYIHSTPKPGLISGLWANALGKGGILPIEVNYYPCGTFLDMKLTGMQGDVMKESMTVAKTLAWNMLTDKQAADISKTMETNKRQGIHIHVPEGATPKDGPSGGTAITCALYSLFIHKPIKNTIAITGEICLQGKVTAIGGLDLKILGGIKAGVKEFIYPKENKRDFDEFMEKYHQNPLIETIQFFPVENIQEVLKLIFI